MPSVWLAIAQVVTNPSYSASCWDWSSPTPFPTLTDHRSIKPEGALYDASVGGAPALIASMKSLLDPGDPLALPARADKATLTSTCCDHESRQAGTRTAQSC
jgi:hypothetical protein